MKLVHEQEGIVTLLAGQVAGKKMILEARRAERLTPPEIVSDAAQEYRRTDNKLNDAVSKLVDLHCEAIALLAQERHAQS